MESILSSAAFASLIDAFGRGPVKDAVTAHVSLLRSNRGAWDEELAVSETGAMLHGATASSLRRVINATGVIIHTNLGRSPIDAELWSSAGSITAGYSNLEFDLDRGDRGARDEHLSTLCSTLFGCEAALLTNNNAAATLLLLASVAAGKEVIVSRGELVEIGGSFRVPDVIQQGGAKLREVGTTNRTRARDYADAVGRKSAALLRVHRSNFDIVGFTEQPSIDELVDVAREKRLPLLYDEGSGRVVDLGRYGFSNQPTISELIAKGVDVVTCSTDKLIGATQGGLILGRAEWIERCRRHPLMRALRAGKESYAVIAETLRAFATGQHESRVPVYRMLVTPLDALRTRGARLVEGTNAQVVDSRAVLGGGTTPTETIPSIAIAVSGNATALHAAFLSREIPIVARIENERLLLDLRTILDGDDPLVRAALNPT
jgi:L-seryl-tRNA(Ser) seleniumtransferase